MDPAAAAAVSTAIGSATSPAMGFDPLNAGPSGQTKRPFGTGARVSVCDCVGVRALRCELDCAPAPRLPKHTNPLSCPGARCSAASGGLDFDGTVSQFAADAGPDERDVICQVRPRRLQVAVADESVTKVTAGGARATGGGCGTMGE